MSQFDQLQQLMSITREKPLDLTDIVDGLAQQLRTASTKELGEAIQDMQAAGINPSDYLPIPKSVLRQRQQEQRMRHLEERHQIELKALQSKVDYEAQLARDLSKRGQQRPKPQQLPFPVPPKVQAPKPMPPVPQPPAQP